MDNKTTLRKITAWVATLFLLIAIGVMAGCSPGPKCKKYHACCKAALANKSIADIFEKKTRCYRYEETKKEKSCDAYYVMTVGEINAARLPMPAECK